jgi:uncharacterized membrane protein HdeD (DUF308 family)
MGYEICRFSSACYLTSSIRSNAMSNTLNPSLAPHDLGHAIERLRSKWGAIAAFGVLLMALGFASLVFAFASTIAMVTLNGVFFIIAGAAEIGVGMHAQGWGRFFLWVIGGVINMAFGILCILNPVFGSVALTLVLGAALIAAGVVRFYLAFQLPGGQMRTMVFVGAAVTFFLGLIILMNWPVSSLYVLGTLLGVELLFHGAGWASFGIGLRRHK